MRKIMKILSSDDAGKTLGLFLSTRIIFGQKRKKSICLKCSEYASFLSSIRKHKHWQEKADFLH